MKKFLFIVLCIISNIAIVFIAGKPYMKMMDIIQNLRFKYFIHYLIDVKGNGVEFLLLIYLFLIPPLSAFFAKEIKQIGIKKYWFINFILQCIVIVLCQLYNGFFDNRFYPEYMSFKKVLYNQFILTWDHFIVIFLTFSMITIGIYYNQLLWYKILLKKKKNKDIICKKINFNE